MHQGSVRFYHQWSSMYIVSNSYKFNWHFIFKLTYVDSLERQWVNKIIHIIVWVCTQNLEVSSYSFKQIIYICQLFEVQKKNKENDNKLSSFFFLTETNMTNEDHTDFKGTLFLIFIKREDNKSYSEREKQIYST